MSGTVFIIASTDATNGRYVDTLCDTWKLGPSIYLATNESCTMLQLSSLGHFWDSHTRDKTNPYRPPHISTTSGKCYKRWIFILLILSLKREMKSLKPAVSSTTRFRTNYVTKVSGTFIADGNESDKLKKYLNLQVWDTCWYSTAITNYLVWLLPWLVGQKFQVNYHVDLNK